MIVGYIVISMGILSLAYVFGAIIFIWHWAHVYRDLVNKPWGEAMDREDWDECDHWSAAAALHLKVNILNPIHWIRYWNWAPKPFDGVQR